MEDTEFPHVSSSISLCFVRQQSVWVIQNKWKQCYDPFSWPPNWLLRRDCSFSNSEVQGGLQKRHLHFHFCSRQKEALQAKPSFWLCFCALGFPSLETEVRIEARWTGRGMLSLLAQWTDCEKTVLLIHLTQETIVLGPVKNWINDGLHFTKSTLSK